MGVSGDRWTAGREVTTIQVPSNWEQQGFGSYNYGQERDKSKEQGLYRRRFTVPDTGKNRRIRLVFEGVMTDAAVRLNGAPAGPVHTGGFYRFSYEVTALVKHSADNLLEVDVAKVSANAATETAERQADYWVFGGIYRPLYLEALPAESIEHVAIDARADGTLLLDLTLPLVRTADRVTAQVMASDGSLVGEPFSADIPGGGIGRLKLAGRVDPPRLWSAEAPHLYSVRLTLYQGDEVRHTVTSRFEFPDLRGTARLRLVS